MVEIIFSFHILDQKLKSKSDLLIEEEIKIAMNERNNVQAFLSVFTFCVLQEVKKNFTFLINDKKRK